MLGTGTGSKKGEAGEKAAKQALETLKVLRGN